MASVDPYAELTWRAGDFNRWRPPAQLHGMPVMLDRSVPPDTVRLYGGGRHGGKMLLLAQLVVQRESKQ